VEGKECKANRKVAMKNRFWYGAKLKDPFYSKDLGEA